LLLNADGVPAATTVAAAIAAAVAAIPNGEVIRNG
jgi:hypothetical protein